LPDWIGAHVRTLAFMGGVPAQLVPDNPKVGVDRANWYEPGLNRTYLDLATHYRTAILPTRTRKPRDKAKVEVAVLVVERWILARLRNRRFCSLAELNRAIAELLADLNARPTAPSGWKRRAIAASTSAPAPTVRSNRSSSMASIGVRPDRPRRASSCRTTPTSAAPATTTEEVLPC
jgi:hypothetical protein